MGLLYLLYDFVGAAVDVILSPVLGYPKVELILVMLVVPALLNALQFWIIDSFIKKKKPAVGRPPAQTADAEETLLKV